MMKKVDFEGKSAGFGSFGIGLESLERKFWCPGAWKWLKNGQKWFKNGEKWPKMGRKWFKNGKKMVKKGEKYQKTRRRW